MVFACTVCEKTFQANYGLRRHYRKMHPTQEQPGALVSGRKKKSSSTKTYPCAVCHMVFGCQTSLWRHKRKHLPPGSEKARAKSRIIMGDKQILKFPSSADFYQWKKTQEDASMCKFVKFNKDRKCRQGMRVLYRCHRSGYYRPRGKGVRRLKVQGTCKIGGMCPATMYTVIHESGEVTVNYCGTHVGHGPGADYIVHRWTRHLRGIHKQHRTSETMDPSLCVCLTPNSVFSVNGNNGKVYRVEKCGTLPHAGQTCALECKDCKICIHAFTCTCRENPTRLRRSICKHVHLVVSTFFGADPSMLEFQNSINDECQDNVAINSNVVQGGLVLYNVVSEANPLQKRLQMVKDMSSFILTSVEQNPEDLVDLAYEHLSNLSKAVSSVLEKIKAVDMIPVTTATEPTSSFPYQTVNRTSIQLVRKPPTPPPNKLPIPRLNRPAPPPKKPRAPRKAPIRKIVEVVPPPEPEIRDKACLLEAIAGGMEIMYNYVPDNGYIINTPLEQMRIHHY